MGLIAVIKTLNW